MHYYKKLFIFILLILIFTGCSQSNEKNSKTIISTKDSMPILELTTPSNLNSKETTEELKVAFIADQGINENAKKVLQLIKNEKTDMVIHTGDFGCCNSIIKYLFGRESYIGTALDWDAQITNILGHNFPYFGTIGNHDGGNWSTYQKLLQQRVDNNLDITCVGNLGIKSSCNYKGLFFLLSGAGEIGNNHDSYINDALEKNDSIWEICSWHKNQKEMQIAGKKDEVGWEPYEECRKGGAIIATGHSHTYSRTKTLTNTITQEVHLEWNQPNEIKISKETENQKGSTFVFVSAIGGESIRAQERCKPITYPYGCNNEWAKIYTSNQNAKPGALFIIFHIDGDPTKAKGYFKNIDNEIIDEFIIYNYNK